MDRYKELAKKQSFTEQEKLLREWEATKQNDPDLYIAYFNYYFNLSSSVLSLTTEKPKGDSLALTKPGSAEPVGYIGGGSEYNKIYVDKAFKYIDRGIEKFPDRLDMRFGKVYVLGRIQEYSQLTDEIVKAINYSQTINNKWVWIDGKVVENPKKHMLGLVQDYVIQLFNSGDEQGKYIKTIAETVLKYYPDHVENLSNLSIYFIINNDFDKALEPLLKAEKIAPTDPVILGNIAFCYYSKRDKVNAVLYYETFEKLGGEQQKKIAAAKLAEIKSWK